MICIPMPFFMVQDSLICSQNFVLTVLILQSPAAVNTSKQLLLVQSTQTPPLVPFMPLPVSLLRMLSFCTLGDELSSQTLTDQPAGSRHRDGSKNTAVSKRGKRPALMDTTFLRELCACLFTHMSPLSCWRTDLLRDQRVPD